MGQPFSEDPASRPNDTWIRRVRLPAISGKSTVAIMVVLLLVTGVIVVPLAGYFDLPPWLRIEALLAVWWVVWAAALARLLYLGRRISDDHVLGKPRDWLGWMKNWGGGWGDAGGVDAEGCFYLLAAILAVIVAIIGLWLLIEIAIPAIAFLLYFLVRGMLARVANDDHGCKDHLGKSAGWGGVWATVYFAPLAVIVWLAHVIHAAG